MNDDELIGKIRLGDEQAAEILINRYYAPILRYCKRHCALGAGRGFDAGNFFEAVSEFAGLSEKPETGHGFSALARNIWPGTRKNT